MNIRIEPSNREPVFTQLIAEIKLKIAQGHLAVGEQLPAVRKLALQLMLNPNTVQKAYNQLILEGIIYSKRGIGVFVADIQPTLNRKMRTQRIGTITESYISECIHLGLSFDEITDTLEHGLNKFKGANQ